MPITRTFLVPFSGVGTPTIQGAPPVTNTPASPNALMAPFMGAFPAQVPPGHAFVQEEHRTDWKKFLPVLDPIVRIAGNFLLNPPTLLNGQAASATNVPQPQDIFNHVSDALVYQQRSEYIKDAALLMREVLDAISK